MSHVRKIVGLPACSLIRERVPGAVQILFRSPGDHNVSEVQDISDLEETLATRALHEEIIRQASHVLKEEAEGVSVLSTESCAFCQACTYPEGKPCRHPERMFPCVESCGIIVTDIAEQYGIEFFKGNIVTCFSILFYR